jgi:hypothetical protein
MKRRNADLSAILPTRETPAFEKAYAGYEGFYRLAVGKMKQYFPGLVAYFEGLPSAMRPQDIVPANVSDNITDVFYTMVYGRDLVAATLHHKEVPKSRLKAFEKAHRDFNWKKRPRNAVAWFARHLDSAKLLLDTKNWPDKGATVEGEAGRVFHVGSFTVHDQAAGDPRPTAQILLRAEELLRATNIARVSEVIYGDVYFVGAIDRKKTVQAQYLHTKDVIQLLLVKRVESRELFALIHEFGHRYFRKVLTAQKRNEWNHYDFRLRQESAPSVSLPAVGDTLPDAFRVNGKPGVVVLQHLDTKMKVQGVDGTLGMLGYESYRNTVKALLYRAALPTKYSRTDSEEHFCDTFALYVEGQLPEKFVAPFQKVVGVSRAANPRARARLFR